MKIEPLSDEHLASLNPGIRHTVKTLREWGFDTRDSGDGTTAQFECDLSYPYVHIVTAPATMASETDRLIRLLESQGINFADCPHPQEDPEGAAKHPCVEASYLPLQAGFAAIHVLNVILPENDKVKQPT